MSLLKSRAARLPVANDTVPRCVLGVQTLAKKVAVAKERVQACMANDTGDESNATIKVWSRSLAPRPPFFAVHTTVCVDCVIDQAKEQLGNINDRLIVRAAPLTVTVRGCHTVRCLAPITLTPSSLLVVNPQRALDALGRLEIASKPGGPNDPPRPGKVPLPSLRSRMVAAVAVAVATMLPTIHTMVVPATPATLAAMTSKPNKPKSKHSGYGRSHRGHPVDAVRIAHLYHCPVHCVLAKRQRWRYIQTIYERYGTFGFCNAAERGVVLETRRLRQTLCLADVVLLYRAMCKSSRGEPMYHRNFSGLRLAVPGGATRRYFRRRSTMAVPLVQRCKQSAATLPATCLRSLVGRI